MYKKIHPVVEQSCTTICIIYTVCAKKYNGHMNIYATHFYTLVLPFRKFN